MNHMICLLKEDEKTTIQFSRGLQMFEIYPRKSTKKTLQKFFDKQKSLIKEKKFREIFLKKPIFSHRKFQNLSSLQDFLLE